MSAVDSTSLRHRRFCKWTSLADAEETKYRGGLNKTIGSWGSFVFLTNSMIGHGVVLMPLAYQHSGWVGMLLAIGVCSYMSSMAVFMLAEAMTKMRGNERLQGRVTFMQICRHFLQPAVYKVVMGVFVIWTLGSVISAIAITAQVADQAMLAAGNACCWELYPTFQFTCISTRDPHHEDSVFGESFVISLGYIILGIFTLPLCFMKLGENMFVQGITFISLTVIYLFWTAYLITKPFDGDRVPAFGNSARAIGFILFNFAYVVYGPAWINEKEPGVHIENTMWAATVVGALVFIIPCMISAYTLDLSSGEDLLTALTESSIPVAVQVMAFLYPLLDVVASIPVFCIVMRYNLVEAKMCSERWANIWSIVLPWILAVPFYGGNNINAIVAWVGIIGAGPLNFIVPPIIFLASMGALKCASRNVTTESLDLDSGEEKKNLVYTKKSEAFVKAASEIETAEKVSAAAPPNSTYHSEEGYFRALPEKASLIRIAVPWLMIVATVAAMILATIAVANYGDASDV